MQAVWNDHVIAQADKADLQYLEGNWYFPPTSVQQELLQNSDTPYTCPWKGRCQYFNLVDGDNTLADGAFCYPELLPTAIERVHKDFSGYIVFTEGVEVRE